MAAWGDQYNSYVNYKKAQVLAELGNAHLTGQREDYAMAARPLVAPARFQPSQPTNQSDKSFIQPSHVNWMVKLAYLFVSFVGRVADFIQHPFASSEQRSRALHTNLSKKWPAYYQKYIRIQQNWHDLFAVANEAAKALAATEADTRTSAEAAEPVVESDMPTIKTREDLHEFFQKYDVLGQLAEMAVYSDQMAVIHDKIHAIPQEVERLKETQLLRNQLSEWQEESKRLINEQRVQMATARAKLEHRPRPTAEERMADLKRELAEWRGISPMTSDHLDGRVQGALPIEGAAEPLDSALGASDMVDVGCLATPASAQIEEAEVESIADAACSDGQHTPPPLLPPIDPEAVEEEAHTGASDVARQLDFSLRNSEVFHSASSSCFSFEPESGAASPTFFGKPQDSEVHTVKRGASTVIEPPPIAVKYE